MRVLPEVGRRHILEPNHTQEAFLVKKCLCKNDECIFKKKQCPVNLVGTCAF